MQKKKILAAACLCAGAVLAGNAFAAEPGVFVGVNWGGTQVDVELEGEESDSDSDHAFVLRGGYYFTPNIAVEVFHANLYDYSEEGYSAKLDGNGAGVVARKNFGADGNGFYVQGRAGMFRSKGAIGVEGYGEISESSTDPYFGLDLGYDFTRNFGLGLGYTRYTGDFDDLSVDASTVTANLEFRF